jgi:alkyl hydroperoxide reductase subunit AhpF
LASRRRDRRIRQVKLVVIVDDSADSKRYLELIEVLAQVADLIEVQVPKSKYRQPNAVSAAA